MTAPYAPSQLVLSNFDATQTGTATWLFSSSDTTVTQGSFDLQIYNNATGALVIDTGTVASASGQYTIPANTLINRTQYKARVQYTDSKGNVSPWSQYVVFTCSSIPVATITSPMASQTVNSSVVTIANTYQQTQSVAQQSYRTIVYATDKQTIVVDSGTVYNTANQFVVSLANGQYYVQVIVTSSDGLVYTTAQVPFAVAYSGLPSSLGISTTPLPLQASLRIDFTTPKTIPGNYSGPGAVYKPGIWGQAIQVAAIGEKVYWSTAPFSQFTYTSWWIPNLASSAMRNSQIIGRVQADSNNYVQVRYDPVSSAFILEQCITGSVTIAKSTGGLAFAAGADLFVAIRVGSIVDAFVGVGGSVYKFSITPNTSTGSANTFGQAVFGVSSFTSNTSSKPTSFTTAYIGCGPQNGNEANALFDQTQLLSVALTDAAVQSIYTSAALQQFSFQSIFLANFDGTLEGGTATQTPVNHWNVYRVYGGAQKFLGSVSNTDNGSASFIDPTPLSGATYQYNVVPVDSSGNTGTPQIVQGTVSFNGWWLYDQLTGFSFQFLANMKDTGIKTDRMRTEYDTFGVYPIVVYGNKRSRSGKLSGWIINNLFNNGLTPYQQWQNLQAMIDRHDFLLLRGDEGWGMMVDCYDETDTIPGRGHQQYNDVEITWTEVAPLT